MLNECLKQDSIRSSIYLISLKTTHLYIAIDLGHAMPYKFKCNVIFSKLEVQWHGNKLGLSEYLRFKHGAIFFVINISYFLRPVGIQARTCPPYPVLS